MSLFWILMNYTLCLSWSCSGYVLNWHVSESPAKEVVAYSSLSQRLMFNCLSAQIFVWKLNLQREEKPEYPDKTLGVRLRSTNLSPHEQPGNRSPGSQRWKAQEPELKTPTQHVFNMEDFVLNGSSLNWTENWFPCTFRCFL